MQQRTNIIPTAVRPIMKPVSLAFNSPYSDVKLFVVVVVVIFALVYKTVVGSYVFFIKDGFLILEAFEFLI